MWKENLYQAVEILIREHEVFPIGEHQHSFFEMVYIQEGSGTFYTCEEDGSKRVCTYKPKSLYLIVPNTIHCFQIESYSRYVFLRFTLNYVNDFIGKTIAQTLFYAQKQPEIHLSDRYAQHLQALISLISDEQQGNQGFSSYLQQQSLNTILAIVARHFMQHSSEPITHPNDLNREMYILQYIQQHIHQPELLRTEVLSKSLRLSPNYLGRYFKHHFQESLQQYISRNRITAVQQLLLHSSCEIKEIAYRMGYTDSCHLIKQFREHYGMTPLQYRRLFTESNPTEYL